jgi:hypothetical protein
MRRIRAILSPPLVEQDASENPVLLSPVTDCGCTFVFQGSIPQTIIKFHDNMDFEQLVAFLGRSRSESWHWTMIGWLILVQTDDVDTSPGAMLSGQFYCLKCPNGEEMCCAGR